jgi:serine/threonine-protein kinase PknK
LARIKALRGDTSRAREILDEGDLVADSLGLDRLKLVINLERVQLGISPRPRRAEPPEVSLPAAAAAAEAIEAVGPRLEGLAEAKHQILLTTQLRSAMAAAGRAGAGSPTNQATANAARHLLARAAAYQGPRAELNARILLSAALEQAGNRDEAEATLLPALDTCCRLGMVRPVVDGGASCLEVVRAISAKQRRGSLTDSVSPELPRFLSILIRLDSQTKTNRDAGWSSGPVHQTMGAATMPVPEPGLSPREQTILHLVEENRSNREIAQELHLGINTVKWYLKSLFNTLGVSDRRACVTEARRRHLLTSE